MKQMNVETRKIIHSREEKQETLVAGVEAEISKELTIEGLSMEGSSQAMKGTEDERMVFVPTSFVERKPTLKIDQRGGKSNGTNGNNKKMPSMETKEKKGADGGLHDRGGKEKQNGDLKIEEWEEDGHEEDGEKKSHCGEGCHGLRQGLGGSGNADEMR